MTATKLEVHETIKKIDKEAHPNEQKKKDLIILTGITTSQINQASKAPNPYPARVFLKVKSFKEDIPVFFRLINFKEKGLETNWERPKIKTGSWIECRGYFNNSEKSSRPSFTAYSYQILDHGK